MSDSTFRKLRGFESKMNKSLLEASVTRGNLPVANNVKGVKDQGTH